MRHNNFETLMSIAPLYYSMEGNTTSRQFTRAMLKAAGASTAFIDHYETPYHGRHSVAQELDGGFGGRVLESDDREFEPSIGGGFFEALWEGNLESAWARADGNNRDIMRKAGLAPSAHA